MTRIACPSRRSAGAAGGPAPPAGRRPRAAVSLAVPFLLGILAVGLLPGGPAPLAAASGVLARFQVPPPVPAAAPAPVPVGVLHGTLTDGAIRIPVWIAAAPAGPRMRATALVDTGAAHTMVDPERAVAVGVRPVPGLRATYGGVGGAVTVGFYSPLYVWPVAGGPPLLVRATEPGGLAGTVLASQGVAVLLGQDVLAHWHLVQAGTRWTLRYTPAG
ncbi:MAG: hypothetical protein K6V97_03105 [Actinomycetia bacterium]|nr:hypothetical protein [Actinomycetes bacterium]